MPWLKYQWKYKSRQTSDNQIRVLEVAESRKGRLLWQDAHRQLGSIFFCYKFNLYCITGNGVFKKACHCGKYALTKKKKYGKWERCFLSLACSSVNSAMERKHDIY